MRLNYTECQSNRIELQNTQLSNRIECTRIIRNAQLSNRIECTRIIEHCYLIVSKACGCVHLQLVRDAITRKKPGKAHRYHNPDPIGWVGSLHDPERRDEAAGLALGLAAAARSFF